MDLSLLWQIWNHSVGLLALAWVRGSDLRIVIPCVGGLFRLESGLLETFWSDPGDVGGALAPRTFAVSLPSSRIVSTGLGLRIRACVLAVSYTHLTLPTKA